MKIGMEAGCAATLWDLLPARQQTEVAPSRHAPHLPGIAQEKYDRLVREMRRTHGVRIVRWRKHTTGCAWQVTYDDGSMAKLIESPYPRGPVSAAVFLHEVAHHAMGFFTYRPRCYEEYMAWQWAFERMRERRIPVNEQVRKRFDEAMADAVEKAGRRGIKNIPEPLRRYMHPGYRRMG